MKRVLNDVEEKELQRIAEILIGLPYVFGQERNPVTEFPELLRANKQAFDCSELVQYLYGRIGYSVPDGSFNQKPACEIIKINDMEVGDLVFKERDSKVVHVGICIKKYPIMLIEATPPKVKYTYWPDWVPKSPKQAQLSGIGRLKTLKRISFNV